MTIGEKIQFYREIRGLSQTALAELSDVSINTLRKYENNTRNPKPEQVQKIANALQISIHALIDIDIKSIDDIA
ncbi:transcriptional regulator, partial [Lachnotalea glycerini]